MGIAEPERLCPRCGRLLVVQVLPDRVDSRCVRCDRDERPLVRGVLFDLDDTLVFAPGSERSTRDFYARIARRFADAVAERAPGIDRDAFAAAFAAAFLEHWEEVAEGRLAVAEFRRRRLDAAFAAVALEPQDEDRERLERQSAELTDTVERLAGAVEALERLRARGLAVGVLTNGVGADQRRKLAVAGLERHVDAVAVSSELGAAKPKQQAFQQAAALLGLAPHECAMVGDSLEHDIRGALAAGLSGAIWLAPADAVGAAPPGAERISRLDEVEAALGL